MKRGRGYYRRQRKRTIRRKCKLLYGIGGQENLWAWTHGAKGRLAKGKIHCSCPLCRRKSCDEPTARDKRAAEKAKDMISEHRREEAMAEKRDEPRQA